MLVNRELIEAVFGYFEVVEVYDDGDSDRNPTFDEKTEIAFGYFENEEDIDINEDYMCSSHYKDKVVNVYEFAHKCKEWAFDNGYWLQSYVDGRCYLTLKSQTTPYTEDMKFNENSEQVAIFMACKWIITEQESKSEIK